MKYARLTTGRAGRQRRGARGQALVEFALIVPVFCLIFFGTIEFALIIASVGGFNFAARDAARLGTLIGRSDPNADAKIVTDANGRVQALVMAKGIELDIYRSDANGACLTSPTGASGKAPSIDDPTCAADRYNMDGSVYGGSMARWPVADRDDTLQNADYLGVRIVFQYNWLTAFVADTGIPLRLSAISVQRIEPLEFSHQHRAPPLAAAWSALAFAAQRLAPGPLLVTVTPLTTQPSLWRSLDSWRGHP